MQVDESVRTYGRTVPLRSTVVYGGIPMDPQIKALRAGVEILVATPGRLLDLVGQKVANLGQVEILVLDEADRMLDMGFLPDIQRIIELLPKRRQNLMFSATFSDDIRRLSGTILRDPETVEVAPRNTTVEGIRQLVYPVDRDRKEALLAHLIRSATCTRCWSSRGPSWRPRGWRRVSTAKASTPWPSTATVHSPSGRVRSKASRPATSASSWRPTSRPADWTSRTCRSSSTSSSRGTRRITSTASAGPAGPGRRARRSASSASTRSTCCAGSSGC